jgi:hypothetical protein
MVTVHNVKLQGSWDSAKKKKVLARMELRMFFIAPCCNQRHVGIELNPGKQTGKMLKFRVF